MDLNIEQESVNTIRTLSIDAIDKANSGHPGLPLGAAPMAYALWSKHMKFNPKNPEWLNRDRFVLSAGHGSALLYSVLHLCGYDLSIEDLKNFRQWNSKTPGHPEFGHTAGVETTTGPLGQGAANAVGMAIAEKMLSNKFNTSDIKLIDHFTYCFVGDGCLMEGISSEAASIAGYMKLGKLIMLYDSNDISLDGPTSLTFTEDVKKRYESYGWHVIRVEDGDEDIEAISEAIKIAKSVTDQPTMIIIKTTIGYGSPNKQGSEKSHGSPLGDVETALTKQNLKMDPEKKFYISGHVKDNFKKVIDKAISINDEWDKKRIIYSEQYPELYKELIDYAELKLPENWSEVLPKFEKGGSLATRVSNHKVMNAVGTKLPWLVGGDADLSCSTKIFLKEGGYFDGLVQKGRNIRMGVREHAMAAIANGISFHGSLRPFTSTFFSFVDYMRPSIRLAALCKIPVIYIFTHDSIAVGEDGPTHQPVEQLMSVRSMPGVKVIRPGDANEVSAAWKYMMENANSPYILVLSRQDIQTVDREKYGCAKGLEKGAYTIADSDDPVAVIFATGSEVNLAIETYEKLKADGINTRVVSIPSWDIFEEQDCEYKRSVLLSDIQKRISIETGVTFGWCRYTGNKGLNIGVDQFGASAPGDVVLDEYGFTVEKVYHRIKEYLNK
ncbi:MAG: transketolase [Candidatus Delongbacteria bacterium]|nr:transketolase [Candidatus Delongbacteria bacterium]